MLRSSGILDRGIFILGQERGDRTCSQMRIGGIGGVHGVRYSEMSSAHSQRDLDEKIQEIMFGIQTLETNQGDKKRSRNSLT